MTSKQNLCPERFQSLKPKLRVKDLFTNLNVAKAVTNDGDPLLRKTLTIAGKDGDDVPPYLEKQLEDLLARLEELRKEEDS